MTVALEWRDSGAVRYLAADLGHAQAAFSTRLGGISKAPFDSLNLGILTDDAREHVVRNRVTLAEAIERDPAGVVMGRQVHGIGIQLRLGPPVGDELIDTDGQLTTLPELTPLVLVADCIPLALAAPGATAMVHCGWRGLAGGIADLAVTAICENAGCKPADVRAAVGPGIGPCCYEVGKEVVEAFAERGHEISRKADLGAVTHSELVRAGVPSDQIATSSLCTCCRPELFFSHRRDDGRTGRQAGVAWLV